MNISKQMSIKQSIIFVIVITVALFIAMQVVKAYGQSDNDMIKLDNSNVTLRYECIEIKEPSFNGDLEVTIWKHKQKFYTQDYLEVNIPCETWREVVQYFLDRGYMISYELDFVINMVKKTN